MANSMKRAYIAGVGMSVPDKIVTNDDFTRIVDTSDEWITQMTGIKERRYTTENEATSDLAIPASRVALERAGVKGSDVDAIIVATATPDTPFPSTACRIQEAIGAKDAFGYDVAAACAGFIFALAQAQSFLISGMAETVLVVGAECLTKITDFTDRNSCVLFGDGAGAVVVKSCDPPRGIVDLFLKCDGTLGDYIIQYGGGSRQPASHKTVDERLHTIQMKGRKVYISASKAMADAVVLLMERQGLTGDDLDLLFPHQANIRIIQSVAEKAGIPMEKVFVNIHKYGNTSAASVPIALAEAYEQGLLKEGMLISMVAFGSGFSWGSALLRW
ncbi:MAG: beta-ketoacyl-ACP synthase III [Candidatus Eisenbacteria bacterium]